MQIVTLQIWKRGWVSQVEVITEGNKKDERKKNSEDVSTDLVRVDIKVGGVGESSDGRGRRAEKPVMNYKLSDIVE